MKSTFRLIYKFLGFIFLFFLLGTLFVFIETVMIENNTQSFIDESRYEYDVLYGKRF